MIADSTPGWTFLKSKVCFTIFHTMNWGRVVVLFQDEGKQVEIGIEELGSQEPPSAVGASPTNFLCEALF